MTEQKWRRCKLLYLITDRDLVQMNISAADAQRTATGPMLKPYFSSTRLFCQHPTFSASVPYTCVYSILGLCINIHHLRKHLGNIPIIEITEDHFNGRQNVMLVHDLKIITIFMGLVQYSCLLVGCLTENPSLFLPHLSAQLIIVCVKILNASLALHHVNMKTINIFRHKVISIVVMSFNWLQGFCAFRKHLCICDL